MMVLLCVCVFCGGMASCRMYCVVRVEVEAD